MAALLQLHQQSDTSMSTIVGTPNAQHSHFSLDQTAEVSMQPREPVHEATPQHEPSPEKQHQFNPYYREDDV